MELRAARCGGGGRGWNCRDTWPQKKETTFVVSALGSALVSWNHTVLLSSPTHTMVWSDCAAELGSFQVQTAQSGLASWAVPPHAKLPPFQPSGPVLMVFCLQLFSAPLSPAPGTALTLHTLHLLTQLPEGSGLSHRGHPALGPCVSPRTPVRRTALGRPGRCVVFLRGHKLHRADITGFLYHCNHSNQHFARYFTDSRK